MIPALSSRPLVWLLAQNAELAADLNEGLLQHGSPADVQVFSDCKTALQALEQADSTAFPGLLITDQVGLDSAANGKCFADSLQDRSPLTNVLVHSRSWFANPAAVQGWRAKRFVFDCLDKEKPRERLWQAVELWLERFRDPLAARFREYVVSDPRADAKFFEGDRGEYLSLLDIYHELLRGTPFARDLEPVWKAWLDAVATVASA